MSFYRIYRPQVITDIDNESVRETLLSLLTKAKDHLPHAFLLTGLRGSGKTTTARIIAKLFNCTNPEKKSGPCGTCEQCTSIANGNNFDVIEMDAASNRGIDDVRVLKERIHLTPRSASYTIYIIDEVHMLTAEAFNALLKTLEEPPKHAVFVLATTDPQKIPVTVQSRCVLIPFQRASKTEMVHAMSRIIEKEKIDIAQDAIDELIERSEGSFRDAVKLLEQLSFSKGKITAETVRSSVSATSGATVDTLLLALQKRNLTEAMSVVESIVRDGTDTKTVLTEILSRLGAYVLRLSKGTSADSWNMSDVTGAIRIFTEAYGHMKYSPVAELPLELAVAEFCTESIKQPEVKRVESNESSRHEPQPDNVLSSPQSGLITLSKLVENWQDVINALKSYNHSIAGVLRSTKPKSVRDGVVTVEAFYKFHQEKLSEVKTKEIISGVLKKLFGEAVKVEIVLGKK